MGSWPCAFGRTTAPCVIHDRKGSVQPPAREEGDGVVAVHDAQRVANEEVDGAAARGVAHLGGPKAVAAHVRIRKLKRRPQPRCSMHAQMTVSKLAHLFDALSTHSLVSPP
jgi:hypothetical protein